MIIDVQPDKSFSWSIMNNAAENHFGIKNEDYAGHVLTDTEGLDAYRLEHRLESIAILKKCVTLKEPVSCNQKYPRADGLDQWGCHGVVPFFSDQGEVEQMMITSRDITAEVVANDESVNLLIREQSGFVAICTECKLIRHRGEWQTIEEYVLEETDFHELRTGICPSCRQ